MTIRLNELATVLLFALVGGIVWMLKHGGVTVVTVPEWATEPVETEDLPNIWGEE